MPRAEIRTWAGQPRGRISRMKTIYEKTTFWRVFAVVKNWRKKLFLCFDTIFSINVTGDRLLAFKWCQLAHVPSSDNSNSWRMCQALIIATVGACAKL